MVSLQCKKHYDRRRIKSRGENISKGGRGRSTSETKRGPEGKRSGGQGGAGFYRKGIKKVGSLQRGGRHRRVGVVYTKKNVSDEDRLVLWESLRTMWLGKEGSLEGGRF